MLDITSSSLVLVRKSVDSAALVSNCWTMAMIRFRACSSCWGLVESNSSWNEASSHAKILIRYYTVGLKAEKSVV